MSDKKDINHMTRRELEAVPTVPWEKILHCDAVVILPARRKRGGLHESGYRFMSVVCTYRGEIVGRTYMCSDVLHLGGILTVGEVAIGWSVDCLPTSGLLRVFASSDDLEVGPTLSSLEVRRTPKWLEATHAAE